MPQYNTCYLMGKSCRHATVLGDCVANKRNCENEMPFILNDNFDEDIDEYLDYDLFEEEDL